jgi:hypothetical protein
MNSPQKVLIIGGQGRIGRQVAVDLLAYTSADVTITGRQAASPELLGLFSRSVNAIILDLDDDHALAALISQQDLVIHCAGPFHYREGRVLQYCINSGVNYLDVSVHRSFYQRVIGWQEQAIAAGITAILNAGIFPGISNSMVRQGVEQLDEVDRIHLSYVVSGSGGAGLTVMRTTFLGLREAFSAWIGGQWQGILPYTEREIVEFPKPYGKIGVYWFDMPETHSFVESFAVKSVITKFGSVPDFYNHLTWITAHIFPSAWVKSPKGIEFFSKVSYQMTRVTDRWSGIGVAMVAAITGKKDGKPAQYSTSMVHDNTAIAAGAGAGMVAQALLSGKLHQPGIYAIEQIFPTELFEASCQERGIIIDKSLTIA